jgi:hypothetical protein
MDSLILHSGGKAVTREEMDLIPMPKQTETYQPVSHFMLANHMRTMAQDLLRGFTLDKESYGVARDGAQMFGVLGFRNGDTEMGLSVGFRNSYDKSMSIGFCVGASIVVCDNLAFSGGIVVMRKHTKNVWEELEERTVNVLYRSNDRYNEILADADAFKIIEMTEDQGFQNLGLLYGHEVIGPRQMAVAKKEWVRPRHEEFRPRNAWSLYNAVTESLKSSPPGTVLENHIGLHDHFKGLQ